MKRIAGIGNALTDMLVNMPDDSILEKYSLAKGSMNLVDGELQTAVSKAVAGSPYTLSLGGSAGNTIRALASLGYDTGFIGEVGHDTTGDFFEQALRNLDIEPHIFRGTERSGKCVSLISPDGERTMLTHLGAALEMRPEMIDRRLFAGFDSLYIEGYLVQDHALIRRIASEADAAGFLAGLCDGLSLRQCGTLGAIAAGKVIEIVGTTLGKEAWSDMRMLFERVRNDKYLF